MDVIHLLGSLLGLSFVAGINLYATVLAVGLGLNMGLITLSPELAALAVLGDPAIVIAAAFAYTMEFFADKVPWVDSFWDAFHTFIRPVGAALIAARALGDVSPALEILVVLLCGGVAFVTHAAKSGVRLVVNQSPEPFTNIGISLAEDVMAVWGVWAAFAHPVWMLMISVLFVAVSFFFLPRLTRVLRVELTALAARLFGGSDTLLFDPVPDAFRRFITEPEFAVRAASGKGVDPGRNLTGILYLTPRELGFVARKGFRIRHVSFDRTRLTELTWQSRFLADRLLFRFADRTVHFTLFKSRPERREAILAKLKMAQTPWGDLAPGRGIP